VVLASISIVTQFLQLQITIYAGIFAATITTIPFAEHGSIATSVHIVLTYVIVAKGPALVIF
jgi:hypothetical protein